MSNKKLIIFDLDGVLIDAKHIHYMALNDALPDEYKITEWEHLNVFDGLKTKEKLDMLTKRKGMPAKYHAVVYEKKQAATIHQIASLEINDKLVQIFSTLRENHMIAIASNSIRRTTLTAIASIGIMPYVDLIISNEDVINPKPHPEMYWKAMSTLSVLPDETLIVEDSPPGLLAAQRSGAHVLRVENPYEWDLNDILNAESRSKKMPKWKDNKMNVIIPMAGAGSRFVQAGYTFPKPLIDVNGKPMIEVVTENLGVEANFHYIVQKEHREKYNLDSMLNLISPKCKVIEVDGLTEGAACTALMAKEFIDNDNPLFFANSDQFVDWNPLGFFYYMQETKADGGIVTFEATHPKWSFARLDEAGKVIEVAEKNPISTHATVGFYYWKHGSDFVRYAEQMIANDTRVNGEFYVCPVFNEAIQDGKIIRTFNAEKMWGLGTPEDLVYYLENHTS